MSAPHAIKRYTPQEYYALERDAAYKSDYYDGEIFAMSGGSSRHSLIAVNIAGELRQRLKGRPCAPYEANQRLKVLATGLRTYPDVSVFCGKLEYDAEDAQKETATNPTIVFEVLSPSTEAYDRGLKAAHYRRIDSLRAHVLVSQDAPHVEVFERQGDGSWRFSEVRGREAVVALPSVDVTLPLAEIYDRVEFGDEGVGVSEAPPKRDSDAGR